MRADLMGSRSSRSSSSPETGSLPFSSMYFSMSRFSKTAPDFLEATGSSGASPEIAHSMLLLSVWSFGRGRGRWIDAVTSAVCFARDGPLTFRSRIQKAEALAGLADSVT